MRTSRLARSAATLRDPGLHGCPVPERHPDGAEVAAAPGGSGRSAERTAAFDSEAARCPSRWTHGGQDNCHAPGR